ncbi:MAG: hypothetical protein ABI282_03535, partial [Candidatus Baltobacteraceae bacterium]
GSVGRAFVLALAVCIAPSIVAAQTDTPAPGATPLPEIAATPSAPNAQDGYDGKWHTSITPYIWAPHINGTLVFRHPALVGIVGSLNDAQIAVGTSPGNYLSLINSGGLIAGEVRKDAFAVAGDLIFLNLSDSGSRSVTITGPDGKIEIPLSSSIGAHLNNTIWEIIPGFTVAHGNAGNVDVFLGVRSISMHGTLGWTFTGPVTIVPLTGDASGSINLTDVIGGVRGKLRLSDRFFVPYYGDVGSGGSNSTSQYYLGIGYAERWGNLVMLYRSLGYNQNGGNLVRNLNLAGLAIGATFKL